METSSYERVCLCALNTIFGYRPAIAHALISHLGSGAAVFALEPAVRRELLRAHPVYAERIDGRALDTAARHLEHAGARGVAFVSIADDCYPELLRECPDHPVGLYVCSSSPPSSLFGRRPLISIVGTRDMSSYGREWCGRIVEALAATKEKPAIVSGLAYGTDITAHMKALDSGLPTFAVMATGTDSIYPRAHRSAAGRIARSEGSALITDFPPGTAPAAVNFIRRNRIIAGLSSALILTESRLKGGGMITAGLACGYSRPVFALPGRLDDERSLGCIRLIGNKSAETFSSPGELARRLGLHILSRSSPSPEERIRSQYSAIPPEKLSIIINIYGIIASSGGLNQDEICRSTGLPWPEVSQCTAMLESDGFISIDLMQRCTAAGSFFSE